MHFASQFNILPSLLTTEQTNLIFRSLAHDKSSEKGAGQAGLTHDEFCQGLFRMAIKSQHLLKVIFTKFQENLDDHSLNEKNSQVNQENIRVMINESKVRLGETILTHEQEQNIKANVNFNSTAIDKNKEDEYGKIDEISVETLEGLIIFLDIPSDLKSLTEKLKSLRIENAKIVPPRDKKMAGRRGIDENFNTTKKRDTSLSPFNTNLKQKSNNNNAQTNIPLPIEDNKNQPISTQPQTQQSPIKNEQKESQESQNKSPQPKDHQSIQSQSQINQSQSLGKTQNQNQSIKVIKFCIIIFILVNNASSPKKDLSTNKTIIGPEGKVENWKVKK